MKKNLLVLTTTFPGFINDSTPPYVYELSKRMTQHFNVIVLAPFSKKSNRYDEWSGIKIIRFKYWLTSNNLVADFGILPNLKKNKLMWLQIPFLLLSEFIQIIKITYQYKIDIIHAHWTIPHGFFALCVKKLFGINYLVTSHGGDSFALQYLNFLKKKVINNSIQTTVVSRAIKTKFLEMGVNPKKLKILPMGVNFKKFTPKRYSSEIKQQYNPNGKILLFVGRLTEKKGIEYLIKAMPLIIHKHPAVKLLIIGTGEDKDYLVNLTEELDLREHIFFLGGISNDYLPEYYATADIFVGPSIITNQKDQEGFGIVFVESLGCKTITIATDLPAIKDIVMDNKTGYIVQQKNDRAIAQKVNYILNNFDDAKLTAERGYEHVLNNFSWPGIALDYMKILDQ